MMVNGVLDVPIATVTDFYSQICRYNGGRFFKNNFKVRIL